MVPIETCSEAKPRQRTDCPSSYRQLCCTEQAVSTQMRTAQWGFAGGLRIVGFVLAGMAFEPIGLTSCAEMMLASSPITWSLRDQW